MRPLVQALQVEHLWRPQVQALQVEKLWRALVQTLQVQRLQAWESRTLPRHDRRHVGHPGGPFGPRPTPTLEVKLTAVRAQRAASSLAREDPNRRGGSAEFRRTTGADAPVPTRVACVRHSERAQNRPA